MNISLACIYQGAYPSLGRPVPQQYPEEFCDDGNDIDGDGCSYMCELEDASDQMCGYTWNCTNVLLGLEREEPIVRTICESFPGDPCKYENTTIIEVTEIRDPTS